jgi:hypothetical protein
MIEQLTIDQVELGSWILRNDLISSIWVEDRINSREKLESFRASYIRAAAPCKFKIVL